MRTRLSWQQLAWTSKAGEQKSAMLKMEAGDRSDRDTGHKISRKNKQAPLGKLLPELTKPWSWPQLHKQEGKLTKKKGPARASGTADSRTTGKKRWRTAFFSSEQQDSKTQRRSKENQENKRARARIWQWLANISIEIHTSLQPIHGSHRTLTII
jgi:hypothetical protein